MKTNLFYMSLLALAALSCTKENPKMSPGTFQIIPFDVKMSSLEVKAGETVKFQFEGNADTVYFYSGEFGKDYNYIGGREVSIENPTLRIHTNSSYGEQKSLSILLSQDFDEDYSYEGITSANWRDMTSKFNIPAPMGATVVNFSSDLTDISEFIVEDKPYYLAVRNNIEQSTSGNRPTQWYFYGYDRTANSVTYPGWSFTGLIGGESTEICSFADADWKMAVHGYVGTDGAEWDGTAGPRVMYHATTGVLNSLFLARNKTSTNAMDTWAVTKAIANKVPVGGDKGTIIKRDTDLPLEQYTYVYNIPGEYDVTFHGGNKDKTKKLIQLKITVTP
ncbi:DUF5017 domain-containing protein [Sphingobacterium sp. SGG-5]|uniref:DUF5017 domain-containing protein n=1 Tax=Sphingobacterium sp. SGG-5 TaxID=2710881 RepID=UPI0013EE37AC|nr:DUF5017 domain-containing protein [Sphingobacterium sp. SGG-5]NGM63306.1 DUF5017 domain-containing protein [Sphingobacterium sp. SGG-5]